MPLPTGARLGRYEIRSLLGAGGMGEVYLAQDTKLGRPVATTEKSSHSWLYRLPDERTIL